MLLKLALFSLTESMRKDPDKYSYLIYHNTMSRASKLFCEMNDILIPWKKITRGLPKGTRFVDESSYYRIDSQADRIPR
jgi:hypothetical protein